MKGTPKLGIRAPAGRAAWAIQGCDHVPRVLKTGKPLLATVQSRCDSTSPKKFSLLASELEEGRRAEECGRRALGTFQGPGRRGAQQWRGPQRCQARLLTPSVEEPGQRCLQGRPQTKETPESARTRLRGPPMPAPKVCFHLWCKRSLSSRGWMCGQPGQSGLFHRLATKQVPGAGTWPCVWQEASWGGGARAGRGSRGTHDL